MLLALSSFPGLTFLFACIAVRIPSSILKHQLRSYFPFHPFNSSAPCYYPLLDDSRWIGSKPIGRHGAGLLHVTHSSYPTNFGTSPDRDRASRSSPLLRQTSRPRLSSQTLLPSLKLRLLGKLRRLVLIQDPIIAVAAKSYLPKITHTLPADPAEWPSFYPSCSHSPSSGSSSAFTLPNSSPRSTRASHGTPETSTRSTSTAMHCRTIEAQGCTVEVTDWVDSLEGSIEGTEGILLVWGNSVRGG
jgi:hypothetical protein